MKIEGHLDKMKSINEVIVKYILPIDENLIDLNALLGQNIKLSFFGQIDCMNCGKQTKTSFAQGYCYNCFITLPETDECTLRPEKCKAHLGVSRDMEWSKTHCLTDHIVYLSFTGNIKVGVTRLSQVPTRWIDQGAIYAIQLAQTPNRHIAGLIEVYCKQFLSDKTSWQLMLKAQSNTSIDLLDEKYKVKELLPDGLKKFISNNDEVIKLNYPALKYPDNVVSVNLNKTSSIQGILTAIKGQYLIFDNHTVINIRSHRGYKIALEY